MSTRCESLDMVALAGSERTLKGILQGYEWFVLRQIESFPTLGLAIMYLSNPAHLLKT